MTLRYRFSRIPNAARLAMSGQTRSYPRESRWTAVDEFAFSRLHPSTSAPSVPALDHALANMEKAGVFNIAVSPALGKYLQLQARLVRAKHILEVGTLGGYSTIWLANAAPDVKVTTVEVDKHHADVARANLKYAGVSDRVDIRLGPGMKVLPQLAQEIENGKRDKFQFVFIDADKQNNWNYVDMAIGMCEPGTCIIIDNVVRNTNWTSDIGDTRSKEARQFVENIGKDDRLEGVVVQTVGERSWDGFLFAVVK
jgi:predicted O-methyltransferase YrrM